MGGEHQRAPHLKRKGGREREEEEEEERVADNQSPFKVVVLRYIHTYCESLYVKS